MTGHETAPAELSGTVKFLEGTTVVGSSDLAVDANGIGTSTLALGAQGSDVAFHTIIAEYQGDDSHDKSSSRVRIDQNYQTTTTGALAKPAYPRSGSSLTWDDFTSSKTPILGKYTATCVSEPSYTETHSITNVAVTTANSSKSQCRVKMLNGGFQADFSPTKSQVIEGNKTKLAGEYTADSKYLLAHERIHSSIAQEVMRIAAINWSPLEEKSSDSVVPALRADNMSKVAKTANEGFKAKWEAYKLKLKSIWDACDHAYDTQTNHGDDRAIQASWLTDWKIYVSSESSDNGWSNK